MINWNGSYIQTCGGRGVRRIVYQKEKGDGEGNGNPLQCSCLENSMDRGAWWATLRGITESQP